VGSELAAILDRFKASQFAEVTESGHAAWQLFVPILRELLEKDFSTLNMSRIGWLTPALGGWILFFVALSAKLRGNADYQAHFEAYVSHISKAVEDDLPFQPGLDELHKAWAEAKAEGGCQNFEECQRLLAYLVEHKLLHQPAPVKEDPKIAELCSLVNREVIVLTGTIQSGKSTLARYLHKYAGVLPPERLKVGRRTKPTTMIPSVYELDITPQVFQCIEHVFQGQEEVTLETIKELRKQIAVDQITPQKSNAPVMRLTVLDTPGLNVADESQDEQHVFDILQLLSFFPSVSQMVMVTNGQTPFGNDFERFLKYYHEMIPALQPRFVILHTHFGVISRMKDENSRKNDFLAITSLSLQHFFVDISTDDFDEWGFRFNEALTHNLGINALLFAAAGPPITVGNIEYKKTSGLQKKEGELKASCCALLDAYKIGIQQLRTGRTEAISKLLVVYEAIDKETNKLDSLNKDLEKYTSSEWAEVGVAIGSGSWGWFWSVEEELVVTAEVPIMAEHATAVPSYGCKITNLHRSNDYEIRAMLSAPMWTSLFGKLTARVPADVFYEKHKVSCIAEIASAEKTLHDLDQRANEYGAAASEIENERQYLRSLCKDIASVLAFLEQTSYTIDKYLLVRRFFDSKENNNILLAGYFSVLGLPTPAVLLKKDQREAN